MEQLDHPLEDILTEVNQILENDGVNVFQKFTCEACKNRLTIEEPNTFYTSGKCDACGHVTDIKKNGCNFMVIARLTDNPGPRDV